MRWAGGWLRAVLLFGLAGYGMRAVGQEFEVATVKPAAPAEVNSGSWSVPGIGRFTATHVTLALLMQLAYGVDKSQIANQPGWMQTEFYDVVAKPEEGVKLSREELQPRLQNLLAQRFHLEVQKQMRPTRGYALEIAVGGAHLTPTAGKNFPGFRINVSPGQMRGANWTMAVLAKYLTAAAGFPVVDRTGLSGSFDIAFSYAADTEVESRLPPSSAALKEATGLLLKPEKVPVETVVIVSVDKMPVAN